MLKFPKHDLEILFLEYLIHKKPVEVEIHKKRGGLHFVSILQYITGMQLRIITKVIEVVSGIQHSTFDFTLYILNNEKMHR